MKRNERISIEGAIILVKEAFDAWEGEYQYISDWSMEHEACDMAVKALKALSKSNDEQYWDGFDNGVISTFETVCDEIKRIRESDEQGNLLSILEDFVLEQKSVFELAFKRKEQENEKASKEKT